MAVLLIPWLVIWIVLAINPSIGGGLGVMAASMPLLCLIFRPVDEQISAPIIALLSLAILFNADIRIIVPASYLIFGLIWFISAFAKTPLTAYYSAVEYDYESAFSNPLFMRTNRILTAVWGILYLVTPI